MRLSLLFLCVFAAFLSAKASSVAIDTGKVADAPLVFSGSADAYYKYDFAGKKYANILTSFANEPNSVSIGMIDLGLKKKNGKASFVGELSFGPRGQNQSIPNGSVTPVSGTAVNANGTPVYAVNGNGTSSFHIQNLYISYDLTDQLNITGGYMATFIGYEITLPTGNFNYSTSYIFTNSPFENAGVKATYAFSDKVSLMAGIFNDYWNVYQAVNDVSTFGAQLMVVPVKGWTAYLNVISGYASGTEFDLTTNYQLTSAFKLGLNAADFTTSKLQSLGQSGGFSGIVLYPQYEISKDVTLGLRGEYFKSKSGSPSMAVTYSGVVPSASVMGLTLTANIKSGPLTFIPEVRLDHGSQSQFLNSNGNATKSAGQFLFAAVYAF